MIQRLTEDDVHWAGLMALRWHLTVRDQALFQSILAEHAGPEDDVFESAALLLHRIAAHKPFQYANKRTAWTLAATLLTLNAVQWPDPFDPARAADLVIAAGDGRLDREQVAQGLRELFEVSGTG